MGTRFASVCLVGLMGVLAPLMARAQARAWKGTMSLPVYEEGLPNPNPPFDVYRGVNFDYPYTLRDSLTDKRVPHTWRALFLENKYLKCTILPDLGGHLYTCVDKVSGQPMFYANPSIKKAKIGYRGAWATFGIEFNFPVSHNWVSLSPVDFAYAENSKDGTASVTVGNTDRVYGMSWKVQLVLQSSSTVLEERVTLYNRSDVRHRYYWWNNAAIQVWGNSRVEYPMQFTATHFSAVEPWPIAKDGKNLSVMDQQTDGPVSLFAYGTREPFMGIWNPKTDTGTVHYADYSDVPGKKIWSWGNDADGKSWRTALSDNDSEYVEVQSGLFQNQETYSFLQPQATIHFNEYWMPVWKIGGISRANLTGVLDMSREGDQLKAGFNANRDINGAEISITQAGKTLLHETVNLTPEHAWLKNVTLTETAPKCTFTLSDAHGKVLLQQTEGKYDWIPADKVSVGAQKSYTMPDPAQRSEGNWLEVGKDAELDGNNPAALTAYQDGLKLFPNSFALRKAAGRLSAAMLRYNEAVRDLKAVQARDTSDPEIAYYLGIAYDGLGRETQAQLALEAAWRQPSFRAAAGIRLAELRAREGAFADAERFLNGSLQSNPGDLRAAEELAAVLKAEGRQNAAQALAKAWLVRDPLSDFLREVLGQPDINHLAGDPYRLLNVAREYMRLGLYAQALDVLSRQYPHVAPDQSEPGYVAPQDNAMVAYYRAYCLEKLNRPAAAAYAAAAKLPTTYVFPNAAEDLTVLKVATESAPSAASAHALLGTLYFSRGLSTQALAQWRQAQQLDPQLPEIAVEIGDALLRIEGKPHQALAAYRTGLKSDASNPRVYEGMDEAMSVLKMPAAERVRVFEQYPDQAAMPTAFTFQFALTRAEAGQYSQALALLHSRFFARQEGTSTVEDVIAEVKLLEQLQGACPAETASGAPLNPAATPRENFLLGQKDWKCGDHALAKRRFQAAEQTTDPQQIMWAAAAAKKLPNYDEAEWHGRLETALAQAKAKLTESNYTGLWAYTNGALELALGQRGEGEAMLNRALMLPDHYMSRHLAQMTLMQNP